MFLKYHPLIIDITLLETMNFKSFAGFDVHIHGTSLNVLVGAVPQREASILHRCSRMNVTTAVLVLVFRILEMLFE